MTASLTDPSATATDGPGPAAPFISKFGGTSLATGERIRHAAGLVAARSPGPQVVVVSAMAGVTNRLATLASTTDRETRREVLDDLARVHHSAGEQLLGDGYSSSPLKESLSRRLQELSSQVVSEATSGGRGGRPDAHARRDRIMSAGEDLSSILMAEALRARGLDARRVDARRIVRTNDHFGQAIPQDDTTVELARAELLPLVEGGTIPVTQGFLGATAEGRTTTLGRGGSDFTAAIIGAALGASEVTIWTDVDGIFTADPRHVPDARVLAELGYEEAVELAYFGARVIHPAAAKHAVGRKVWLRIRNTFRPETAGTLIRPDRRGTAGLAALAFKPRVVLITVRSRPLFMAWGFLARVFEVLTRNEVPVDLVATSHTSTAFTVEEGADLHRVTEELEAFAEVEVERGLGTVTAVGAGLRSRSGLTGRLLTALDDVPVRLVSQATDAALSVVVEAEKGDRVLRSLHAELVTEPPPADAAPSSTTPPSAGDPGGSTPSSEPSH